jgi:hypothetical protein
MYKVTEKGGIGAGAAYKAARLQRALQLELRGERRNRDILARRGALLRTKIWG